MEETWRRACATYMEESIAEPTEHDRREEPGSRNPMVGNGHWGSRHWRTKSFSTRSGRFSTRYGKRTFWVSATVSGQDADNKMLWTRCGWESCGRKWTGFWISTFDLF